MSFAKEQFSSDKLSSPKYTSFSKFIERWKSIFFLYIRWFETSSFDPRQVMNRRLFLFVFFQKKGSKFQKRRSVSCKFQQCTSLHSPTIRKTSDCRHPAVCLWCCFEILSDCIRKTLSGNQHVRKLWGRCLPDGRRHVGNCTMAICMVENSSLSNIEPFFGKNKEQKLARLRPVWDEVTKCCIGIHIWEI